MKKAVYVNGIKTNAIAIGEYKKVSTILGFKWLS